MGGNLYQTLNEAEVPPPINLSRSGSAAAPQLMVLGDEYLVFWRDAIGGFAFSRLQNETWSAPVIAEFPFATRTYYPDLPEESSTPLFEPLLRADQSGIIHAFWQDEEANLYYSKVPADAFADFTAWQERVLLGQGVVRINAVIDAYQRIHLAYFRSVDDGENPAGLYYRRSGIGGENWLETLNLYDSAYVRLLDAEDANLQMAIAGEAIYIAWDDPAYERVMIVHSEEGGSHWNEPQLIDRRFEMDYDNATGPQQVRLLALGEEVHLTWQAGHDGQQCAQHHQWSIDRARTWSEPQEIMADVSQGNAEDCPVLVEFLVGQSRPLLLTRRGDEAYLAEWINDHWVIHTEQVPLFNFDDEETYRTAIVACGHTYLVEDESLVFAACATLAGEVDRSDIWFGQLAFVPLPEIDAAPVWSSLALVNEGDEAESDSQLLNPVLLPDGDGRWHAFWSETGPPAGAATIPIGTEIIYSVWDDGRWARPVSLFGADGQKASDPAVVLLADGRLVLVWSGGKAGEIYCSWAAAQRATIVSEWAEPAILPAPHPAGSAPAIALVPGTETIYVSFAIPFNEGRGIYLTHSPDGGESWEEAEVVFDAVAAGWSKVDQPHLTVSNERVLHLTFEQQSLPGTTPAAALYYIYSTDGGTTWSEPEAIKSGLPQSGMVTKSEILIAGDGTIHIGWQEWIPAETGNRSYTLWHLFSSDNGLTWSRAGRVGNIGADFQAFTLLADAAGGVHLLALNQSSALADELEMDVELQQWRWLPAEQRWEEVERLPLVKIYVTENGGLVGALSREGSLAVLFTGRTDEFNGNSLYATWRTITLPDEMPTPRPTFTATPTPTPFPTATPRPEPTPIPVVSNTMNESPINLDFLPFPGGATLILGAILALIPAILLVLLAVVTFERIRLRHR